MKYRFILSIALLLLVLVTVSACGGAAAPVAAPAAPATQAVAAPQNLPVEIDAKTANSLRGNANVFFLDVREPNEYAAGHIAEAQLIPLGQLASRVSELPKDKTIVAVCRSGNRSGQATQYLLQQGFNVHNMDGGMNAWQAAGYDIAK